MGDREIDEVIIQEKFCSDDRVINDFNMAEFDEEVSDIEEDVANYILEEKLDDSFPIDNADDINNSGIKVSYKDVLFIIKLIATLMFFISLALVYKSAVSFDSIILLMISLFTLAFTVGKEED